MTEDIHDLIGKYLSGEATKEEAEKVHQWIDSDENNKADFQLLKKFWEGAGEQRPVMFDTQLAWTKVDAKIRKPAAPYRVIAMFTKKAAIAVAASLILALSAWWIVSSRTGYNNLVADTAVKDVILEDGSKVYLRNGASLRFPEKFAKDSRQVSLSGEAFFEVTPNTARPFVITAGESEVHVIGTSFTINERENNVEVIVRTGKVQFNSKLDTNMKVILVPGEKALLANNTIRKDVNTDNNFNAWQSHQLVFNNTPLGQVATTLSNYYDLNIILKKEDSAVLSKATVTATFDAQSLPSVLKELSLITSYQIKKVNETNYEISIN